MSTDISDKYLVYASSSHEKGHGISRATTMIVAMSGEKVMLHELVMILETAAIAQFVQN